MGLLTSFNAGVSGLKVSQSGINTAAHNISNAETVGYTRQQNMLKDTTYKTLKVTTSGQQQVGYGTTVAQIRQIRDQFLDQDYRLENSRSSFYEQQYLTTTEIEDILGEMEGVEFQNSLQDMWCSIQDLANDSTSIVNRELFISQANAFIGRTQDLYNSLVDYQVNLNDAIRNQVEEINNLAKDIAEINSKITTAEASGIENANDLRDARNQMMDELSALTYYTYMEDTRGQVSIFINNAPLVSGTHNYHMGTEKIISYEEDGSIKSVSEMLQVVWKDNGFDEVYDTDIAYSSLLKTDTGSLLGVLTARGQSMADYTDIPVKPSKEDPQFYNAAGDFIQADYDVALNRYNEDLKVFNNTTNNSILTRIQAQFDQMIRGIVQLVNDTFAPNIDQTINGITGKTDDGKSVTVDGKCKILDVINCPVGTDDAVTIGTEVFSRKAVERYTILNLDAQVYGTDADGNEIPLAQTIQNSDGTKSYRLYVYNEEDPSDFDNLYSVMNLQVNPLLKQDYALLAVKTNPEVGGTGAYNHEIFANLIDNWNADFAVLDPNNQTEYNFESYYNSLVTGLGSQGSTWKSILDNQEVLVNSINDQRQQIMGVSTDEEMASLLQFQHAYNAASRYISTIDQMLEHLIERLGR